MFSNLFSSKNTTVVGICMILGAIAQALIAIFDGDEATSINWEATMMAVVAGYGFLKARDNNVTSEQAGATPPQQ